MTHIGKKFTDDEVKSILIDYKNGMCPKDLGEKYNRNPSSIINKLQAIGEFIPTRKRWAEEDIEFLREYYPKGDFDAIFKRFPNTNIQSIHTICCKYKISADYYGWTDEDTEILRKYYYEKSLEELEKIFNYRYTKDAIATKALKRLGYEKNNYWSDEEVEILLNNYSTSPKEQLLELLPKRSWQNITSKANDLGLVSYFNNITYWSDEDTQFLLENWKTLTDEELATKLNKKKHAILDKRWRLGLLHFGTGSSANYEDIKKYFRGHLSTWKSQSMKQCNYACILTGSKDFAIHHLYSFNQIFSDFIEKNPNLCPSYNLSDYTDEQLSNILSVFIEEHNSHPLGVCVRKDIHDLFHRLYGKANTQEQWESFKKDYYNKKYDTLLHSE